MSKSSFPIAQVAGNELISMEGDKSYFYELDGVDLEQLNDHEKASLFERLRSKLSNLEEKSWAKFYRINNSLYLNCSDENLEIGIKKDICSSPLEVFF